MEKENSRVVDSYYKIILALGVVLSITWVVAINAQPFSDFKYYYDLAIDIANGKPWGDTYTSVGYSIVLGCIFKLFGASILNAKIFNLILTFIANICFLCLLNNIDLKNRDKKIIFAIFVFVPNNIFFNSVLGTEILFTTILLAISSIYFGQFKYKYIWIGILTGLNTMIKPFFIIFFFAIFLVDVLKERKLLKSIGNAIIILIISIITISPWVYRNTKLIGQYTYVSNNGGIVLYINNNSQNNRGRWMAAEDVENSIVKTDEYKNANSTQKNKMLGAAAKKWIASHPKEFIILGFKRLFNTYYVGDDVLYSTHGSGLSEGVTSSLYFVTNTVRHIVFIPAVIYILIYSVFIIKCMFTGETGFLNRFNLYAVVLFFMFTCVYFVTEGQGRYAFPEIFIMVYCFYKLIKLLFLKYKELM